MENEELEDQRNMDGLKERMSKYRLQKRMLETGTRGETQFWLQDLWMNEKTIYIYILQNCDLSVAVRNVFFFVHD